MRLFIPHPEGKETFQPFWPEAEHDLRRITLERAHELYGDPLPEIVQKRIDKELGAIIGYGFSTLYMIAVKLVAKSLSDGYIVGSRGSVGSSLVAYLSGITEVNSLPPHYVCPQCKFSDFDVQQLGKTGLDLPARDCPRCGARMDKDGFNIPFEVFLGFKGNKVPDIDLNFSGVYQPVAHNYIKELFGAENVFRAGTIGTIAEKTAYGYVLKYMEERDLHFSNAEKERLARGITGVKRTTGQHPAGMVVLPKDYEIYQFTAIQHPADDMTSETVTTHFDFGSMHDVLVKLDVLGHDDPTMLRRLQDLTGIPPRKVPLNDPEVFKNILSLFSTPEALGLTAEELGVPTGTLGIPEFGTRFVRGMLVETRPSTMEELIRISGLSHGTDVWVGNTQDLVHAGVPLSECICTRDDIMNALIDFGVDSEIAFKTMESVRKGKGLQPFMEEAMRGRGRAGLVHRQLQEDQVHVPQGARRGLRHHGPAHRLLQDLLPGGLLRLLPDAQRRRLRRFAHGHLQRGRAALDDRGDQRPRALRARAQGRRSGHPRDTHRDEPARRPPAPRGHVPLGGDGLPSRGRRNHPPAAHLPAGRGPAGRRGLRRRPRGRAVHLAGRHAAPQGPQDRRRSRCAPPAACRASPRPVRSRCLNLACDAASAPGYAQKGVDRMGWLTDYLEKLSLIDCAAKKMNSPQAPASFLWKPFSRKPRAAYFAQQKARAKEAERKIHAGKGTAGKDVCGAGKTA